MQLFFFNHLNCVFNWRDIKSIKIFACLALKSVYHLLLNTPLKGTDTLLLDCDLFVKIDEILFLS